MAALAVDVRQPVYDAKATKAALAAWGNWYILRTAHEFGWSSQFACLNYFGLFVGGHKVLFDTPSHVRFVDVAVGQLPELLRKALALEYWWHRDLTTGYEIPERDKAMALNLESPSQFREVVRTARLLAQHTMEAIDLRRESAKLR
jgi:hypothetical protein